MGLFSKNKIFDNIFKLDDDELLFKNCITFSYKNIYDDNYIVKLLILIRNSKINTLLWILLQKIEH